jgi:hypothetical protein
MAGWPAHSDVTALLRLPDPSPEDEVVEWARLAAIDYCIGRIDQTISGPLDGSVPIPSAIFEAAVIYSARFYRRRDSLDGTIGWGDMGVVRVGVKDNDAEALLARYIATPIG